MHSSDVQIEKPADRYTHSKSWGWEEWIVNNDLYCGKRLHFKNESHKYTSFHYHVKKHETMYVESGKFQISVLDTRDATYTYHHMNQGDSLVILPNTPHRIVALIVPSILVEFSTHHEETDSYRIEL